VTPDQLAFEAVRQTARAFYSSNPEAEPVTVADACWKAARACLPRSRAPDGLEAYARTGGATKSYKSPLGLLLDVPGADDYGAHPAKYPRTVKSHREGLAMREMVFARLLELGTEVSEQEIASAE
jgi:hypothetical protein